MSGRVFVTGFGIVSGIGNNIEETLQSVYSSRSGIGAIKYLSTTHKDEFPCSEVQFSDQEMMNLLGIDGNESITRATLMGLIAAREALTNSGIKNLKETRNALISGTTVGGMDKSEMHYLDFLANDSKNQYIDTHDCGTGTERIADFLGVKDFITTISTACSSAANAIMLGTRMIKNNLIDRAIVGGTECLTKYHLNGFNTLMILDKANCKPFDKNRKGLNLGEGAAYLVLESERVIKPDAEIFCEVKGYGNSCEAYHQTASSADGAGAFAAMKKALEMSGLSTTDIDYINAHGTGTSNNDLSEGTAIGRLFSPKIPHVSSTKSFTGHTTSAAGGVEAVLCMLAMKHKLLIPNLNFGEKMDELNFEPVINLIQNYELKHIMSNSFGFGGNNTSLIFSKV